MKFAGQLKEKKEVSFDQLNGLPVVKGALTQVTCEVVGEHVEGDHTLFIGKVTAIHLEENEPLLFFNRKIPYVKTEPICSEQLRFTNGRWLIWK